jgi:polysaccharide biosynthesis transport protein
MNDRMIQRPFESAPPDVYASAMDATARLEPAAVPLGRAGLILRRHFWVILLTFAVGVGLTGVVVKGMTKRYTAEAQIIIEPQRTQVSDLQAISSDSTDVSGLVRTQIDILSSPALAVGVVKALKLTKNEEFAPHHVGLMTRAMDYLQQITDQPPRATPQTSNEDAVDIAAAILGTKISFGNEVRSSLLSVAVTTHDPKLSAKIANEIAKQYLAFKVQEKFAAMQRAHDWLQGQVASLADQVRADDLAVESYRLGHGLGEESPNGAANGGGWTATVNRQQLDELSHELISVSRDRAEKEGELIQAQLALRGGAMSTSTLPSVLVSPVVAGLISETASIAGRESQLSATLGPNNPQLVAIRAQLARMQAKTSQQMSNVASSLASQVDAARSQEVSLTKRMEELRDAVSKENSAELGLQTLETKARATRNIYESFLSRAAQLANVAGIQEPDASLVSAAEPPLAPSAPKVTRLLALASALSLALGVIFAVVIERLRGGFSLPEQVEGILGLPLLALMPKVRVNTLRRRRKGRAAAAMGASLDRLRGQMRVLGEDRPKLVMVTSALPKEGKSVFAVELARNTAAAGWRVLLLECDFGCPSLGDYFGMQPGPGLSEILSGGSLGRTDSLIRKPERHLHVILAGGVKADSQEMLASKRMSALLATVRSQYDLVILDTPPVLPVADALVLARQADATLAVVRWESTSRSAVSDAVRLLRGSGAQIMGVVMTQVDLRTAAISGGRMSYAFRHYDGYHAIQA